LISIDPPVLSPIIKKYDMKDNFMKVPFLISISLAMLVCVPCYAKMYHCRADGETVSFGAGGVVEYDLVEGVTFTLNDDAGGTHDNVYFGPYGTRSNSETHFRLGARIMSGNRFILEFGGYDTIATSFQGSYIQVSVYRFNGRTPTNFGVECVAKEKLK
jgi:hypothetical protein